MKVAVFLSVGRKNLDPPESYFAKLKRDFPSVSFVIAQDWEDLMKELVDSEVLFAPLINEAMVGLAQNLKWFHASSIQFGTLVEDSVFKSKFEITNSRGGFVPTVSENIIGAALFLAHRMDTSKGLLEHERKAGAMSLMASHRLRGKTLGILGLGANGKGVASIASSMGMKVVATKRTPPAAVPKNVQKVFSPKDLHKMLEVVDLLVITAPLTTETNNLIKAEEIERLPRDSIIINAGKPEIDDDDAIVDALKSGHLLGYGCDDLVAEDSPVRSCARTNVVIFPHAGPGAKHYWTGVFGIFAKNLKRYLKGESLLNQVHRDLKY